MADYEAPALAPLVDDRTANYDLPMVHRDNDQRRTDVARLRSSTHAIDAALGKADIAKFVQLYSQTEKQRARGNIGAMSNNNGLALPFEFFGAVADGITPCAAAMEAAMAYALANGGLVLMLGKGRYRFERLASFTVPSLVTFSFVIRGPNERTAELFVPAPSAPGALDGNVAGCIKIACPDQTPTLKVLLENFTIRTNNVPNDGVGATAIEITRPPSGARREREVVIRNVDTTGDNFNQAGTAVPFSCFAKDYVIQGMWRPYFHDIIANSPYGPPVNQVAFDPYQPVDWPPFQKQSCLDLSGCYGPVVSTSHLWGGKYGIYQAPLDESNLEGEGLWVFDTVMVYVRTGVYRETNGTEPGFTMRGGHINYTDDGIVLDGVKSAEINGVLFNNDDKDDQSIRTNPSDIRIVSGYAIKILNNFCYGGVGHINRIPIQINGTDFQDYRIEIRGNDFLGNQAVLSPAAIKMDVRRKLILGENTFQGFANEILIGSNPSLVSKPTTRSTADGGIAVGNVGVKTTSPTGAQIRGGFTEDLTQAVYSLLTGASGKCEIYFGSDANKIRRSIRWDAATDTFGFYANNVLQASFTPLGNLEFGPVSVGPVIKSPDGTKYRLSVANGGALSAVPV